MMDAMYNICKITALKNSLAFKQANDFYRDHKFSSFFPNKKVQNKFLTASLFKKIAKKIAIPEIIKDNFHCLLNKNSISALATLTPLPFETSIFGFNCGELTLFTNSSTRISSKNIRLLIHAVLSEAPKDFYQHLTVKINASSINTIIALEKEGFYYTGGLSTYVGYNNNFKPARFRHLYNVRKSKNTDKRSIEKISSKAFSKTRYYNDPGLKNSACNILYKEWAANCLNKKWATDVFIAEGSNRTVSGFIAYQLDKELFEISGIKKGGTGLAACKKTSPGAYIALLSYAYMNGIEQGYDFVEFTAQLDNYEIIRIWQKFGLSPAKTDFCYHKCL
jgi:hypothetical protein